MRGHIILLEKTITTGEYDEQNKMQMVCNMISTWYIYQERHQFHEMSLQTENVPQYKSLLYCTNRLLTLCDLLQAQLDR